MGLFEGAHQEGSNAVLRAHSLVYVYPQPNDSPKIHGRCAIEKIAWHLTFSRRSRKSTGVASFYCSSYGAHALLSVHLNYTYSSPPVNCSFNKGMFCLKIISPKATKQIYNYVYNNCRDECWKSGWVWFRLMFGLFRVRY